MKIWTIVTASFYENSIIFVRKIVLTFLEHCKHIVMLVSVSRREKLVCVRESELEGKGGEGEKETEGERGRENVYMFSNNVYTCTYM